MLGTTLIDSVIRAARALDRFKANHSSVKRLHIICLSDGEDSASENPAAIAAKFLVRYNIVMDSVMLGYKNRELKALCALSGSCSGLGCVLGGR